ncbi:hypothetical protein [Paenibacillus ginsengarvi]|uniref:Uncharacterized protein n=1 Tax=Paenibacillus ginsengarvi TaxID=400777 RepID=A0A3B0CPS2_9BACL|nr:hypothetical protein [Paenibacillus ginsengarvi]RKN86049.1 hypothetical protein D7M11_03285 [Paenibacillus ginsengarvi]
MDFYEKKNIVVASLTAAIVLGAIFEQSSFGSKHIANLIRTDHTDNHSSSALVENNNTLEEEMYAVNLIIRGKVEKIGENVKRDANLGNRANYTYDVTPLTIKVNEVIYGEVPENKEVTLLQFSKVTDSEEITMLNEGDEALLILSKTSDGNYWPYMPKEGIWLLKNGKIDSKTKHPLYQSFKGASINDLEKRLKQAANNKIRPFTY